MAQIRELRNRIKAVGNIERITKTMQMIATAKFQSTLKRATEAKPYTTKLAKMVGELAAAADGSGGDHPLLTPQGASGKELLLVMSSNRGLCGGYNTNVLRLAQKYIKSSDKQVDIEVIGKKGIAFFKFIGINPVNIYTDFTDKTLYGEVEKVAADYITRFTNGDYDSIRVIYTEFISNSRQTAQNIQLLPLEPPTADEDAGSGGTSSYEFSPDPAKLLGELLPLSVKSRFFQFFNDAIVSEQISRMVAMKAATDNAGKINKDLKRSANRARQAMITTELNEIIGGAAALD